MKICAIFNIFPIYRTAIYKKMDEQLDIDFYFGNYSLENIALGTPNIFNNFKKNFKNFYKGNKLFWQRGAIRSAFSKRYTHYILTGNTGILSNWIILLLARVLGRKVILWTHSLYGNEKGLTKIKNLLYLKLATHLFTYNERGAKIAIKNGIKESKITIVYNSLNFEEQIQIQKRIGDFSFARNYFGNDNKLVAFIGRLTSHKKVNQLIEAMSISNSQFNLIIVGDGPCRSELEKLSSNLNLDDRIWFYGECYDESMIATIISNCTFTVSPGNCGLNAIESLTYGVPMITHSNLQNQMPESEAIVELCNKTGINFMFEENNISNLASTIDKCLSIKKLNIEQSARDIISAKWNPNHQIETMVHYLR